MIINVIKFISVEMLMQQMQNFNSQQFLFMNYFSNIPIVGLMAITPPAPLLTSHKIDTSMIKFKNYFPLAILIVSSTLALIGAYFHLYFQAWFIPYQPNQ